MKIVKRRNYPRILTVFIFIIVLCFCAISKKPASADDTPLSWPWSTSTPKLLESTALTDTPSAHTCTSALRNVDIVGNFASKEVCIMDGKNFHFGMYFNGHTYNTVVGFGYDVKMYPLVKTPCDSPESCIYLPDTDVLAVKQPISSLISYLVIYRDFSKHIHPLFQTARPLIEYGFDSIEPDFIFQNDDGYKWPVGGIGGSNNGRWLAIEIRERGIAVLDLRTMKFKRISRLSFQYSFGSMPITEIAISDDGFHVAVTGVNAGLTIIDNYPSCGDELTNYKLQERILLQNTCPVAPIDYTVLVERFKYALQPRFNEDGGELRFYAMSYVAEPHFVLLHAATYTTPRMDYIALGDSFSSGEGETDDAYYLARTNDPHERCHTSSRSYPYRIAQLMSIDPQYMRSVACSGATTVDVVGIDRDYWGQSKRLSFGGLNLIASTKTVAQTSASELFIPGRIHQLRFVSRYHPQAVTIGVGGNDTGLMTKLRACLNNNTCHWAGTKQGREQTALEIRGIFNQLVTVYSQIHTESPNTKIYVVGYPKVIDPKGVCDVVTGTLLDTTEREFMDEAIVYTNRVIEAAAKRVGVTYIDISNSFGDQRLCGRKQPTAMNGLRTGDDQSLIENNSLSKVIGSESFHPTPEGHRLIADVIKTRVNNIITTNQCTQLRIVCPEESQAPWPSPYWIENGKTSGYREQRTTHLVRDTYGTDGDDTAEIAMPKNSLQPNSDVTIEIHSDPITLASSTVSSDGSVSLTIRLPLSLQSGFHTLHLYGTSYSGEVIDLYQVIFHETNTHQPDPKQTNQSTALSPEKERARTTSETGSNTRNPSGSHTEDGDVLGSEIEKSDLQNTDSNEWVYFAVVTICISVVVTIYIAREALVKT